jgi:splicing factor 45
MDVDEEEDEYVPPEPSSEADDDAGIGLGVNRPKQKGFAARMMSKYGWSKGQGLGAEGSGILQPLRVQVEKRKKKSDAEGGGWAQPAGMGKIIGVKTGAGTSSSTSESAGKFGTMSNVIVLRNMLDGMEDLQSEMENGLGQEIGEECGDKYGRVERLYIDIEGRRVFIKFTDQVSALRVCYAIFPHPFTFLFFFPIHSIIYRFSLPSLAQPRLLPLAMEHSTFTDRPTDQQKKSNVERSS